MKFEREAVLSIWPGVLRDKAAEDEEAANAESPAEETASMDVKDGDTDDLIRLRIMEVLDYVLGLQNRTKKSPLSQRKFVEKMMNEAGVNGEARHPSPPRRTD